MIAIDLSKQQALDADPKAIQQINFIDNLDRPEGATMFFIIEEAKALETILDFSQGTRNCESIVNFYYFNVISAYNDSISHFKRKII